LDRGFFSELQRQQLSPPVALAVSGAWMQSHHGDFEWIKSQQRAGLIQVTWVNHSYSHPFVKALPDEENYLLKKGVKISREILETERLMIEQGITPSVFFRFPGLVSDARLMAELRAHQLIPLATNAWLALDQKPKPGSIVLVHANGNEPRGLEKFRAIANQKKLPTPLCDLNESLRETLSEMAKPGHKKHQGP
jgi:peptidoglycan/xylan/chitin deacetylase (PgdA/CDA1 family)